MSTNDVFRTNAIDLLVDYFQHEIEQANRDITWINDNVTDPEKKQLRLSYQHNRIKKAQTMIVMVGTLR